VDSASNLRSIYTGLRNNTILEEAIETRMSPPLLMKLPENWFEYGKRILVVGQETQGWKKEDLNINSFSDFRKMPDSIAKLQDAYVHFRFAKSKANRRNSPFWRAFREIRERCDSNSCSEEFETNVLWTNLYKCDNDKKSWYSKNSARARQSVEKALQGVLLKEIDVLKPTGIIFFTGPRYDDYLNRSLNGNVSISPMDDRFPPRQLAKLCVNGLSILAFRTYHPNYLLRSKNWHVIDLIIKELGCDNKES